MNKISLLLLLLLLSLTAVSQQKKDGKLAGTTDNLNEVKIAPGSLYAFHRFMYPSNTPEQFMDTKIIEKDSAYFLLTKGVNSQLIYAFELDVQEKNLLLIQGAALHTCSKGEPEMATFKLDENQIVGCKSGDYKKINN
jgi:hypothetical protein